MVPIARLATTQPPASSTSDPNLAAPTRRTPAPTSRLHHPQLGSPLHTPVVLRPRLSAPSVPTSAISKTQISSAQRMISSRPPTTPRSFQQWQGMGRCPRLPRGSVPMPLRMVTASSIPAGSSRSSIRPTGILPLWINGESSFSSPRGTSLLCLRAI